MAFPWIEPSLAHPPFAATFPTKAKDMLRGEVRQRAALLRHLGFSQAEATQRCRQNLRWDFDLHGASPILSEIDALVAAVYRVKAS